MVVSAVILGFVIFSLFLSMLGSSPKPKDTSDDPMFAELVKPE